MKKYTFSDLLSKLPLEEYHLAVKDLAKELDMREVRFKYVILNASIEKAPSLKVDQLLAFKNYLLRKYPKIYKKISLDDLVNEDQHQAA